MSLGGWNSEGAKVFCFFFSKKKAFLACLPLLHAVPRQAQRCNVLLNKADTQDIACRNSAGS